MAENTIPEHQQMDNIAVQHNPYVNVSKPQNTIPEYQQNEVFHDDNS